MKVGVFDSGLGGLTVVSAIQKVLKGADIFYVADTAYAPYGEKTVQEILDRCDLITNYLVSNHQIDSLIVACNTATSAAIKHLREKFSSLIVVGTEPGIKPAVENTKSGKIAVLATVATLKGDKYQLLVNQLKSTKEIDCYEQACIGLVEQIEKGEIKSQITYEMLKNWLEPMKKDGVDTIVLGCTHYPLVEDVIKDIMGDKVTLIQTGEAIAKRLLHLSKEINHINEGDLKIAICSTGEINKDMIDKILDNKNIEIRKCQI